MSSERRGVLQSACAGHYFERDNETLNVSKIFVYILSRRHWHALPVFKWHESLSSGLVPPLLGQRPARGASSQCGHVYPCQATVAPRA